MSLKIGVLPTKLIDLVSSMPERINSCITVQSIEDHTSFKQLDMLEKECCKYFSLKNGLSLAEINKEHN